MFWVITYIMFKIWQNFRSYAGTQRAQILKLGGVQAAFDLFAKDHGGTLEQIKALWDEETDDIIRNEYIAKAQ